MGFMEYLKKAFKKALKMCMYIDVNVLSSEWNIDVGKMEELWEHIFDRVTGRETKFRVWLLVVG